MKQIGKFMLLFSGVVFILGSLFFCYYTARLVYINLAFADVAARRSTGMYIGAVVFPVAAIVFGVLSWLCFRKMRRLK